MREAEGLPPVPPPQAPRRAPDRNREATTSIFGVDVNAGGPRPPADPNVKRTADATEKIAAGIDTLVRNQQGPRAPNVNQHVEQ